MMEDSSSERKRSCLSEVVSDCVRRWFQETLKEAKAGDLNMQILVAQMYYSGYGVPVDAQKGKLWMTRASRVRSSVWKVSNKRPGYNASDSDSDELFSRKIIQFFTEYCSVAAINKGNHALLPMAEARVDFLLGVVSRELLEEGVKGEEEALWSIHEFLYNNGWWEKASNLVIERNNYEGASTTMDPLLLFLSAYEHLIHPNTRVEALQGRREAVRMALNQIHYGSIELARQEPIKGGLKSSTTKSKKKGPSKTTDKREEVTGASVSELQAQAGMPFSDSDPFFQFLQSHDRFIHPNTRPLVLNGDRYGIRMALTQIHYGSIEEARSLKLISSPPVEVIINEPNPLATQNSPTKIDPSLVLKDFIRSFRHLVEPSVYSDALQGFDKAISLALGQIHHKTLPTGLENPSHNSYKEVLTSRGEGPVMMDRKALAQDRDVLLNCPKRSPVKSHSPTGHSGLLYGSQTKQSKKAVFFTGWDDSLHLKDLWQMFKKVEDKADMNDATHVQIDNSSEIHNDNTEEDDADSLINVATPRGSMDRVLSFPLPSPPKEDQIEDLDTKNWKTREPESSTSCLNSHSADEGSVIDVLSENEVDPLLDLHPSIIKDLENLKVKSRRGRPRKFKNHPLNKHFKLPRRKKRKGEGLFQVTHYCLNNNISEAESVYETGMLMGLLPQHSKERSMELITRNLQF
ncbi:hypothetical protein ACET3Z_025097 [Daucus carota]